MQAREHASVPAFHLPTRSMADKFIIPRRDIPHDRSVAAVTLGALRFVGVVLLLAPGAVLVGLAALWPWRIGGARAAAWVAVGLARCFLALLNVRLDAPPAAAVRGHRGLIFLNHLSYLDPVLVYARGPVRFLATAGVRGLPFVGLIAMAVGTVFVDRGDRASRAASRERIRRTLTTRPTPPVALAPEGQIGPGGGVLLPFRHGAFEIAVETGLPILPLLIDYAPFDAVVWQQKESIFVALWRLAARTAPVRATVTPLAPIHPGPAETDEEEDAEAERLAGVAEAAFRAAMAAG